MPGDQTTQYHAGLAVERIAQRHYSRCGAALRETRWRGKSGEIDLIFAEDDRIVFVEVKKSRSLAMAAQRLGQRQIARILRSAEEYLARCPRGLLTDVRFDVALVDETGQLEVIPNALMAA